MLKITEGPPDRAGLPQTAYSPGLEEVVMRALATRADARYASLGDMRKDLSRVVRQRAESLPAAGRV